MAKKLVDDEKIALAASRNRLQVLEAIAKIEEEIAKKKEEGVDYDEELVKELEKQQKILSKIDKYTQKISAGLKEQLDTYSDLENSIGNLSSLQDGIKNTLKESVKFGIEFSKSIDMIQSPNKAGFMEINRLMGDISIATSELAQLNEDDATERLLKTSQIESMQEQMLQTITAMSEKMGEMNDVEKSILQNSIKQNTALFEATKQASKFSRISKDSKEIYEDLTSDLETMEKTFKKVAITTQIFFSSFKNAVGMSLIFAGGLVDDFLDVSKSVGGSVTQMTAFKAQAFGVSKILGDEAGSSVTALAEKLGNANDVTLGMSINVGVMTNRLGVSGEEAATLVNQFGNLQGLSNDVALDTMEATSQLASANGVAPSKVMSDIAKNTEFFATYAKDGGANIGEAAIQARKLGVDLDTAAKISDSLIDYQSSVQKEMEASVILGRNLNLNKARELAYAGDAAGAMREAVRAAGDLAALEAMGPVEKRALADAIGVGVDELTKMVANEKHANTEVGKLEAKFSSVYATAEELGKTVAGTAVKGIGGMLIGMKDFKTQVSDAKEGFNFIKDSAKGIGSLLTGGGMDKLNEATTLNKNKTPGASAPSAAKGGGKATGGNQQSQMAKGFKEMGKPGVGMGILNTALAGPALLLFSLGTPGMMAISALGANTGIGLSALSTGLKTFGKVPITAVGTLAATGLAFAVMTAGSIGLASVALLGAPAGAGLSALSVGLRALGKAGIAAVQGIGILGLFGIALIPLAYGLSLLGPIIESVAGGLIGIIDSIGTGIATVVGSITTMMTSILPLLSMDAAGALFAVAGGFLAISAALMTFAGASLLATPGMLAVGTFAAVGGDKFLGGGGEGAGAGGGEKDSLLEEIKGLRADIQAQPIIVQLDGRQVYMSNLRQQKNKSN
jgi:hypothetical protein